MTIYLIRHGKTVANEKHLYCGSTDIPLSEAGRAELMYRSLPVLSPAHYLSSGLQRCNETMEILFGNVPYDTEPDFQEINFGDFEMQSYEQLKNDPAYIEWISGDNDDANIPPNGESGTQMTLRVIKAFREVVESGKDTVIVTHGGVIAAIMENLFPEENKNRYEWQPKNGCGYKISGNQYEEIP